MNRVSIEFINDISERVERLKEHARVISPELLDSISLNLALLKNEKIRTDCSNSRTCASEKKIEEDFPVVKPYLETSLSEKKKRRKTDEDSEDIDDLEQELEDLIGILPSSEHSSLKQIYPDWNTLSKQIKSLHLELRQAKQKLGRNYSFSDTMQIYDVRERIERLENAIHTYKISHQTQSICVCNIF